MHIFSNRSWIGDISHCPGGTSWNLSSGKLASCTPIRLEDMFSRTSLRFGGVGGGVRRLSRPGGPGGSGRASHPKARPQQAAFPDEAKRRSHGSVGTEYADVAPSLL